MTIHEPITPPLLLTAAERAALRDAIPTDHPVIAAALAQGEQLLPFLTQLADLLRAGQAETALATLDAALAPVAALDANEEGLAATLQQMHTAWSSLRAVCPDGVLLGAVLTDPGALRAVADAAETLGEHAQELALRAADRARLLAERRRG